MPPRLDVLLGKESEPFPARALDVQTSVLAALEALVRAAVAARAMPVDTFDIEHAVLALLPAAPLALIIGGAGFIAKIYEWLITVLLVTSK